MSKAMRDNILMMVAVLMLAGAFCASSQTPVHKPASADSVAQHLKIFEVLDFDIYSNQKWDRLSESHADDILVTYPDGHQSKGLKAHIEELKPLFVFAPDTKIKVHPIQFGSGDWTCVTGVMTGTFSKPMPVGNGKTIAPTGKSFKISMATIGHWKNGKMIEESLFWDNQEFLKQLGVGQ